MNWSAALLTQLSRTARGSLSVAPLGGPTFGNSNHGPRPLTHVGHDILPAEAVGVDWGCCIGSLRVGSLTYFGN